MRTMQGLKRTNRVAEFTEKQLGQELTLMGWCHKQRDLGNLIFITLRDRSGELQLVFDDQTDPAVMEVARKVRSEYVLACRGILRLRKDPNPQMATGLYELEVKELRILSEAKTPPFYIEDELDVRESLRLEHRYLDLRRPVMQARLRKRHDIVKFTRDWFDGNGFLEIETPILVKSTPEGARDYLVPSRVYPGQFFALPQSPQIYKQLLMLSGCDRYMQIARCFRDEDLRADRQPEFTQIDLEMSFVQEEEVQTMIEQYLHDLFAKILGVEVELPLPRLPWSEAMRRFGSDKPDMRFGMEIQDISEEAKGLAFPPFENALTKGGSVRALVAKGAAGTIKRRQIDELTELCKTYRAGGLVWFSFEAEGTRGSMMKFVTPEFEAALKARLQLENGDMVFIVADKDSIVLDSLGHLRLELGERLNLIPEGTWKLLWVTDFPMFEYDEEDNRYVAMHHPFTSPKDEDLALLDSDPGKVKAKAYDIILNGNEIGGGSIRIHDQELQKKIFQKIGLSDEVANERFGFLLRAFQYGVPPHGGLAFGLDRLVMLMLGETSIREIIAFPKVQTSSDLMAQCPSEVDPAQLVELGLAITAEAEAKDAE